MKATLTCYGVTSGFRLLAEVEVSEELIDYEGVVNADGDLDFFDPSIKLEDADPKKLSHWTFVRVPLDEGATAQPFLGKIASFHFNYQTALGSFEIGVACPIE